jgi:hypothetical protein
MSASHSFLLTSLCSLCLCGSSFAALDPELRTPYQLRIVLHIADHPEIKSAYRERVAGDLRDALQGALGDLGTVEVMRDHPKLRDVLQNGLQVALDGWKERSGVKTHFVLVRYNGFDYEIQARQHDGVTGLASLFTGQVVRTERTRDREFVARTAALLVARDFGLVGTVVDHDDAQGLVKVAIKGGGLGAPLGPWVKPGEVFGVVGIAEGGRGETVFPWLFLRVKDPPTSDGLCTCRLYFRHANPFASTSFTGFRCVKLGTVRGPVRLRLTQRNPQSTGVSAELLTVFVRRFDFDGEQSSRLKVEAQSDGTVDTARLGEEGVFDHLAFVSIYGGASASAARVPKLPVPILTDQPLDVSIPAAAEGDGLFRFQRDEWTRNVNDSYLVQANLFKRLNDMTKKPELRKEALTEAQQGLDRCRRDVDRLTAERKELEREMQKLPEASRPNLSAWDDRLKKMSREAEVELVNFIKTIKDVEVVENDPERQKGLADISRGELLEGKYEYGEAIDLYENARKVKSLDSAALRDRIARLRKDWEPKGQKHADARAFIYHTLPTLDTPGLDSRLEDLRKHFDECKRVGDRLGPHKLMEAMLTHRQRIEKELKDLNPRLNPEDEPKVKQIDKVTTELGKLEGDVNAYLKSTTPK